MNIKKTCISAQHALIFRVMTWVRPFGSHTVKGLDLFVNPEEMQQHQHKEIANQSDKINVCVLHIVDRHCKAGTWDTLALS